MSDDIPVFDRLLEISDLLQRDMARAFDGTALTPARTHLLWVLHHAGPSTQQALAQALEVTPRNVTGLVDALAASGFLTREQHPTDRRATLVTLTDEGTRAMAAMTEERAQLATALVAGLSDAEVAGLRHGLDRVAERLRELIALDAERRASDERRPA
ncbi:MAG TPA: MarR family transcriptional regulator [Agromyces sp.]|nr:MarR family transcriptional regulator [Agromyces sp.]